MSAGALIGPPPLPRDGGKIRPRPPENLIGVEGAIAADTFVPASELLEWALGTFVEDGAPLYNEDHGHLVYARIGMLWTNAPCSRHGLTVLGQAEFKPPGGTMGKWQRARAVAQIRGWFGSVPDFLITFYAPYAAECSDIEFCALVEHELYHCGLARDEDGAPRFTKEGMPVFAMRGHDIEEFAGIVARYGAATTAIAALLEAAEAGPLVDHAAIARGCGTCHA